MHRGLGDKRRPAGGPQRFVGWNRRGTFVWFTNCRMVVAEADREFAFDVSSFGLPVARWGYRFAPAGDGTEVTEYWQDLRQGRTIRGAVVAAPLTDGQLVALVAWTGDFHRAGADFRHPGRWRYFPIPDATLIGPNDIAYYNACFDGDRPVGVFDWDLASDQSVAGVGLHRLERRAHVGRGAGPGQAARRLRLIADTYGGPSARDILHAVVPRIARMSI